MLSNNASLVYGILMSSGPRTAADLVGRTGLSQPVLSRALNEVAQHTGRLVTHRQGRSIVYAITRAVRSLPLAIPVHQISANEHGDVVTLNNDIRNARFPLPNPPPEGEGTNEPLRDFAVKGNTTLMGTLTSLEGGGYLYLAAKGRSELFEGLPWFLQDMRPQGYIGRSFRDAYAQGLGLSENLAEWSDDDVLYALSEFGEDTPGNLIVGDKALQRFLAADDGVLIPASNLASHYDRMAEAAVQGGVPESTAGGEHPKFLLHDGERDVIVKFSPLQDGTPAATRWKDLLIAEHVASMTLRSGGIAVPDNRIILSAKRCYLESTRFDRAGAKGRIATVSFEAIDNGFIGARRSWSTSASVLRAHGMITPVCEAQIKLIEGFGRCIANTDMHFGNLSFFWSKVDDTVSLNLAPIYDMLPMLYAPEKSEIVERTFKPPRAAEADTALELAHQFWKDLALREDVSEAFRKIAAENAALLGNQ
jgi:hypothetical protein